MPQKLACHAADFSSSFSSSSPVIAISLQLPFLLCSSPTLAFLSHIPLGTSFHLGHRGFADVNPTVLDTSSKNVLQSHIFQGSLYCAFFGSCSECGKLFMAFLINSAKAKGWNGAALLFWFQFLVISAVRNCFSFVFWLESRASLQGREALFGDETCVCVPELYSAWCLR